MCIISVLYILRPIFGCLSVYKSKEKEFYLITDFCGYLFYPLFASIFIDFKQDISTIDLLGFSLAVMGYLVYFLSCDSLAEDNEAMSAISAVKSIFKYKRPREVEEMDV
jgi:hypothetical protein